jgi:hypothetical protein
VAYGITDNELWEKYYEEWSYVGQHELAYAIMVAGPENFPYIDLDPWDEGPFWDHVSDLAEELWMYRAFEKETPLGPRDYVELAFELNNVLGTGDK